jgi:hypothetical protein
VDSFPVRPREKGHRVLEGYIFMLDQLTRPYQIPYRVMIPESVDGLLVPVAASTTHIAFSTVRLEPTWMALGQAAGLAAHLAMDAGVQPRAVDTNRLQRALLERGQVITYFRDIDQGDPAYSALQYFGTKGLFDDYDARSKEPVDRETALRWWQLVTRSAAKELPAGMLTAQTSRGEFCMKLYGLASSDRQAGTKQIR